MEESSVVKMVDLWNPRKISQKNFYGIDDPSNIGYNYIALELSDCMDSAAWANYHSHPISVELGVSDN